MNKNTDKKSCRYYISQAKTNFRLFLQKYFIATGLTTSLFIGFSFYVILLIPGELYAAYKYDENTAKIQLLLSLEGYDLDTKRIDGKLGSVTKKAIIDYRKKKNLPLVINENELINDELYNSLYEDTKSKLLLRTKLPEEKQESASVPKEASHIDTLDKVIRILKPFQEEKELLFRYSELIDYAKFLVPIFVGIYLAGLATIGYYFVKHEISKSVKEVLEKARTDLGEAQKTYKEQEESIADEISKVDNKLEKLSKNTLKIMDVRLTIGAIGTNYYMAALNWRTGNIDTAIQGIEYSVSLIDSLDDDVNDREVASKVKQTKDYKQAMQSDLAYYYAQRYAEQSQINDARCAIDFMETMPEFIKTLSGAKRISMIDNYLFVICKVKDVDKSHITMFIEYYDNYKESLSTLLRHQNADILAEYSKFYKRLNHRSNRFGVA